MGRFFSLRVVWLPIVLSVYVLLGISTVFGGWGLLHLRGLAQERADLEAAVFARLRESEALRVCMRRLETDDTFLEQLAREEFGFVRPDDIVYRFDAPLDESLPPWQRMCLSRFPANVPVSADDVPRGHGSTASRAP